MYERTGEHVHVDDYAFCGGFFPKLKCVFGCIPLHEIAFTKFRWISKSDFLYFLMKIHENRIYFLIEEIRRRQTMFRLRNRSDNDDDDVENFQR